jgi:hypothetical protein
MLYETLNADMKSMVDRPEARQAIAEEVGN